MDVRDAFSLISRAIDADAAANGYLIVGDVRGNAAELVHLVLRKLFPNALSQIEGRCHPDVFTLEPSGKSRTIKAEQTAGDPAPGMRDGLIEPMSVTAFSGGWKVGIIVSADRLQPTAANAFLKSLEEPTPRTLYFLLTDAPEALMPTIISRCQRVDLPLPSGLLTGESYNQVAEVMTADVGAGVMEKYAAGRRLAQILDELKKEAVDEDVPLVRKSFYKTLLSFVRSWMVEGRLPRYQAFRNIGAVEEAARQSDRSINDEMVLTFLMDRLVFPDVKRANTGRVITGV